VEAGEQHGGATIFNCDAFTSDVDEPGTDCYHYYRRNRAGWSGPTGFCGVDYESTIPTGQSKTW
jgi:hypothetical protein